MACDEKFANTIFLNGRLLGVFLRIPRNCRINTATNSGSRVYVNGSNDILVVWMYVDDLSIAQIAAAVYLNDTQAWYASNISQSMGSAYSDYSGSIDDNGDAFVIWTSYNSFSNLNVILGATAMLGTSTVWSDPFVILE